MNNASRNQLIKRTDFVGAVCNRTVAARCAVANRTYISGPQSLALPGNAGQKYLLLHVHGLDALKAQHPAVARVHDE